MTIKPETKTYLGDAVYITPDPSYGFMLTTEDGIRTTNIIALEPATIGSLLTYLQAKGYIVP